MPSSGVLLPESANRVCFFCYCQFCQFCLHSFLRSAWVCIVCVLPRCFQPSNNPSTTLCFCCVKFVICAVNFLYFRARSFGVILVFFGGSRSELTLWNTGAEFLPFLQGCFFPGGYCCSQFFFDGDDSIRIQFLRGFLTAADISCAFNF